MAHPPEIKQKAQELYATGHFSIYAVADVLRLPKATVRRWLDPRAQERDRLRAEDPDYRAKAAARARQQWQEEKLVPEKKEEKYARNREYCKRRWQEIKSNPKRLAIYQAQRRQRWQEIMADPRKREAYATRDREYRRRKRAEAEGTCYTVETSQASG
jgi:Zn-dependent M32 family carboxypeptidase